MTRIAKDIIAKDDFIVNIFDYNKDKIFNTDELYAAFESGWPVVIQNLPIEGLDYKYYDDLED
jgi:hypothetical protein